jgi:hypothetical protein
MSRRLVIGIVLLMVFAVSAFVLRPVGEFGIVDSRIASAHGGLPFDARVWRDGDVAKRGQMVADLARRHRFIGMHPDSVTARLGPSECYVNQDGEPCYRVRLGHSDFHLEFHFHASPARRISAVGLNKI